MSKGDMVQQHFDTMMQDWTKMQSGTMENQDLNEDNAERFEANFYHFTQTIEEWFSTLEDPPSSFEKLMETEPIQSIMEELPPPLLIPFETELEYIFEGKQRVEDEKYD
ncbi:hypothetical protein [Caldalkalibacillus salinus]|uniref:hypothetical protein n=1 Tax=Caldalkalibacillus salinus TaxID=2803787 RepID=UPI0019241F27|nr:hypothetical protein [Caldalkalibacillus salinus]